jgi:preprotein translocase subunit SecD
MFLCQCFIKKKDIHRSPKLYKNNKRNVSFASIQPNSDKISFSLTDKTDKISNTQIVWKSRDKQKKVKKRRRSFSPKKTNRPNTALRGRACSNNGSTIKEMIRSKSLSPPKVIRVATTKYNNYDDETFEQNNKKYTIEFDNSNFTVNSAEKDYITKINTNMNT